MSPHTEPTPSSGRPVLDVEGMRIERTDIGAPIVTSLDLRLAAGESIGIVGESGSGKSMSAKALIGLLPEGVVASGPPGSTARTCSSCPNGSGAASGAARSA